MKTNRHSLSVPAVPHCAHTTQALAALSGIRCGRVYVEDAEFHRKSEIVSFGRPLSVYESVERCANSIGQGVQSYLTIN